MFTETIDFIKECNLTHLHVFPYSIRKSTPAALMPQVPKDIIKIRAKKLRDLGEQLLSVYLRNQIGHNFWWRNRWNAKKHSPRSWDCALSSAASNDLTIKSYGHFALRCPWSWTTVIFSHITPNTSFSWFCRKFQADPYSLQRATWRIQWRAHPQRNGYGFRAVTTL